MEDLETIGLTGGREIIKTDQEPSMTDIQTTEAQLRTGHGTAIEQSRVGGSIFNGRVERASQDFKGLTRKLDSAIQ